MFTSKMLGTLLLCSALSISAQAAKVSVDKVNTKKTKKVKKKKKAKIDKHSHIASIETGLGYDSNPFLTPSNPYLDLTNNGGGLLIQPVIQSGMFIPIKAKGNYEYRLQKDIRLLADIKLDGKFFTDSALKNANQYKTEAHAGARFRLNKYKRETNHIEVKAIVGNVDRIYVDHDTGELKLTGNNLDKDQSNRYKYTKTGAELAYTYKFKKTDFLIQLRYEDRDYEEPESWSSLDHTYSRFKLQGGYQLSKVLHIGAHYEYALRDYSKRKSYDIDTTTGDISLVKPGVNYTYHDVNTYMDYKVSKAYKTKIGYFLSSRSDDNIGYSDFLYHRITWDNDYKFSKKLRSSLMLKYYVYDYLKAYAFDTSTSLPKKEVSGYKLAFQTKYRINSNIFAKFDLNYHDALASDKRFEYDETIAMATVKYKF